MPIAVVQLAEKDLAIMHAIAPLRQLEEKMEPLMAIHDILSMVVQTMVFEDNKEDAKYEIVLDPDHSMLFEMKDGKFSIDQTCNCQHDDEHAEGPAGPDLRSLASLFSMMKGR